jgi:hypothetical protein
MPDSPTGRVGEQVVLSASGDYLAFAAPSDDSEGTNNGAVYTMTRSGNVWSQPSRLRVLDSVMSGYRWLGRSLSMSATGTLVVGTYSELPTGAWWSENQQEHHAQRNGCESTSCALIILYVLLWPIWFFIRHFEPNGTHWNQVGLKKTAALDSAAGLFAYSVAISKDGQTVIGTASMHTLREVACSYEALCSCCLCPLSACVCAVGDPFTSHGDLIAGGAAYLFSRSPLVAGASGEFHLLGGQPIAWPSVPGDYFGMSVALNADATQLAVGSQCDTRHSTGTQ